MLPETRYAKSGDVSIAYQVVGDGPIDLVLVPGWVSNIDVFWEEPTLARLLTRLASFSRLILFDKRGTGLSDRVGDLPSLEVRMDDMRAVMDAVGSERAALFGYSEGGAMCALFAATYPDRASALIMGGAFARRTRAPDYPWGPTAEQHSAFVDQMERDWGGAVGIEARSPSLAHDERYRQWWARWLRAERQPGGGGEADAHEHGDRRPPCAARRARSDAGAAQRQRPRGRDRRRALHGRAHPGREAGRAAGHRPHPVGLRQRRSSSTRSKNS